MISLFRPHEPTIDDAVQQSLELADEFIATRVSLSAVFQSVRYQALQSRAIARERPKRMLPWSTPNSISPLVSGVAVAAAAMWQAHRVRPYPTQVAAAHWMARGTVVEMATGEGKSFAILLSAIAMNALGLSVHIATANDYLAQRDQQMAMPVAKQVGMLTDVISAANPRSPITAAYRGDLVYATLATLGFDHLRIQVAIDAPRSSLFLDSPAPPCSRLESISVRRHRLLIDEIDHCLLDEATTPFVLARNQHSNMLESDVSRKPYRVACRLAERMIPQQDYQLQPVGHGQLVQLTTSGQSMANRHEPVRGLKRPWTDYVINAIRAAKILQQDVDYVIENGSIKIIDKATGRIADGKQWQDGLYQAVQCQAGLAIDEEQERQGAITARQLVSLYDQVSGCSGTALAGEREFADVYGLKVQLVPARLPSQLWLLPPKFFANEADKWHAIANEVAEMHRLQRPVLVGTRSISQSLLLSRQLQQAGLDCQLLNGTQTRDEADVIAMAGKRSAITVATDMAGRGTDIPIEASVDAIGGLHVIASEPAMSPRIDQQLIGRAARQGQRGSARMFVAATDELIRTHAPALQRYLTTKLSPASDAQSLWREVQRAGYRAEKTQRQLRAAMTSFDLSTFH